MHRRARRDRGLPAAIETFMQTRSAFQPNRAALSTARTRKTEAPLRRRPHQRPYYTRRRRRGRPGGGFAAPLAHPRKPPEWPAAQKPRLAARDRLGLFFDFLRPITRGGKAPP